MDDRKNGGNGVGVDSGLLTKLGAWIPGLTGGTDGTPAKKFRKARPDANRHRGRRRKAPGPLGAVALHNERRARRLARRRRKAGVR